MRAVVAGFGFLGSKICSLLAAEGYQITVIRRSNVAENSIACDLVHNKPTLLPMRADVAVFCLAPSERDLQSYEATYVRAQANFLHAVTADHYVYISSTAVYPDLDGDFSETGAVAHNEKSRILLNAESLAASQSHATVLRLAGLYSTERPIYSATRPGPEGDRLIHFIHRDDAARAVIHCLKRKLTGIYNVHDGQPQWRSAIQTRLGLNASSVAGLPQRSISCKKISDTGFIPSQKDYFSGSGSV